MSNFKVGHYLFLKSESVLLLAMTTSNNENDNVRTSRSSLETNIDELLLFIFDFFITTKSEIKFFRRIPRFNPRIAISSIPSNFIFRYPFYPRSKGSVVLEGLRNERKKATNEKKRKEKKTKDRWELRKNKYQQSRWREKYRNAVFFFFAFLHFDELARHKDRFFYTLEHIGPARAQKQRETRIRREEERYNNKTR